MMCLEQREIVFILIYEFFANNKREITLFYVTVLTPNFTR